MTLPGQVTHPLPVDERIRFLNNDGVTTSDGRILQPPSQTLEGWLYQVWPTMGRWPQQVSSANVTHLLTHNAYQDIAIPFERCVRMPDGSLYAGLGSAAPRVQVPTLTLPEDVLERHARHGPSGTDEKKGVLGGEPPISGEEDGEAVGT